MPYIITPTVIIVEALIGDRYPLYECIVSNNVIIYSKILLNIINFNKFLIYN